MDSHDMQCEFTNVLQKPLATKIGLRCLSITLLNPLLGLGLCRHGEYMRKPLKYFLIKKRRKCVYASPIWREGLVRLTVRERLMHMVVNLLIHVQVQRIGRFGMNLRSSMAMRILSRYVVFRELLIPGNVTDQEECAGTIQH
jgi:hypothetical protein